MFQVCSVTLCILGNFFLSSADFFQNQPFRKIISGILSECQTVWTQIRTDKMSVLIWVQTICKDYQQAARKELTANIYILNVVALDETTIHSYCLARQE